MTHIRPSSGYYWRIIYVFYNTGVSYKYTAMNFTPCFTPGVHVYCAITYTLSHSLYSDHRMNDHL